MKDATFLALDPGGTTGYQVLQITDGNAKWSGGQLGPNAHHLILEGMLERYLTKNYYIICERFEYRNTSRAGLVLDSREYIGIVKRVGQKHNLSIAYQNASAAKGFVRDEHIKRLELWRPAHRHQMDAVRHLIYFLVNEKHVIPELKELILTTAYRR